MEQKKWEWIDALGEAREHLEDALEIIKQFSRETGNDSIRRTIVAELEMLISDDHSWLGKHHYTVQGLIEAIEEDEIEF